MDPRRSKSSRSRRHASSGVCRFCQRPTRGRKIWHDHCLDGWAIAQGDNKVIRRVVFGRDAACCALCGLDATLVARVLEKIGRLFPWDDAREVRFWALVALGWSRSQANYALGATRLVHALWQADHTTPLVLGGKNELANLRTLCTPCHSKQTAQLARSRASCAGGGAR